MKFLLFISLFYFVACGSGSDKNNNVIIGDQKPIEKPVSEVITSHPENTKTTLPTGALDGFFNADELAFYAYVQNVNKIKGITTIAFEGSKAPPLVIPKTYGATISILNLDAFDRDLLLVDTKISDPQFHKFHLYILKGGSWRPVVNPFSLQESHINEVPKPIFVDPNNPNNMFRYYSVFDIDETNELGYGWRIHNESVAIINR